MNLSNFGMDTVTLAGPLEVKLAASKAAGFSQLMLWAKDLVAYPGGLDAAVRLVRQSGMRVTGLQVLRDYEGLSGTLHDYKVDMAKNLLQICQAIGCPLLMVCSTTSSQASGDIDQTARDLAKLATLGVPVGVRIAYKALSWGLHVNRYQQAWEAVELADHAGLGVAIDAFHLMASDSALDGINEIPWKKIAMVQLSDFMWRAMRSSEEQLETARHMRVFPSEGVHSETLSDLVRLLHRCGYRGDYSFEVFNDDYLQMSPELVAQRARRSAKWVTDQVLRRGLQVRERAGLPLNAASTAASGA